MTRWINCALRGLEIGTLVVCLSPALAFPYPENATAIAWGNSALTEMPQEARALAENGFAVLVVHPDGSVEGLSTFGPLAGPLVVPADLEPLADVALGDSLAVGLREDGSLVNWGSFSEFGEDFGPPILPPTLPTTDPRAVAIGAGLGYAAALTGSGRLLIWGDEFVLAMMQVPDIDDGIGLSLMGSDGLVLRRDGHVAYFGNAGAWGVGEHAFDETDDAVAVACGAAHALVLHKDGTVSGFGFSEAAKVPEGLADVQAIAAGYHHNLALKTDGTVVSWGNTPPVPEGLTEVVAIYAAGQHSVAWTKAPFISRQPESVAVEPGTPVTLSVEVIDRNPVTYQWWHGEQAIPGATAVSLDLPAPTESDAGLYRVAVSNGAYEVSSREALVVVGKPWIVTGPQPLTAPALSNAVFRVEAVSPTSITYQWRFNGVSISGATTAELQLTNLSLADDGGYSVEVGNAYGSVTSLPVRLTVTANAPLDQGQLKSEAVVRMRDNNREVKLAQIFVPGVSGLLDRVSFDGSLGGPWEEWPTELTIVEAPDERPGDIVLGRVIVDHLLGAMEVSWRDQGVYLQAGRPYALVFSTDSPKTPESGYTFRTSMSDAYPGGDLWERHPDGDWQLAYLFDDEVTRRDLVFGTYLFPGIPAIRLTTPRPDAALRMGEPVRLTAVASPEGPVPDQVELLANDTVLATLATSPFTWDWTPEEAGSFTLVARATTGEAVALSAPVGVLVRLGGPANDDFANRELLPGDYAVVSATLTGSTLEPNEAVLWPAGMAGSVWWQWTAPRSGPVVVVATGPEGGLAQVGVFSGSAVDALVPEAQGTNACTFVAVEGRAYHVALALEIPGQESWSLTLAQSDVGIVQPTDGTVLRAPANLTVSVERLGQGRDLERVELRLNGAVAVTLLGTLDPATASLPIEHSGLYTLTAAAFDQAGVMVESTPVTLTVRPANDNYQQASEITGHYVAVEGSNLAGTRQDFEPIWGDNQGGSSVWYRWTAPEDGLCTLGGVGTDPTTGWEFGLLFAAFREGTPGLETQVAQNALPTPGSGSWMAVAGVTYWILVDGGFGEQGDFSLWLRLRPVNDDYDMASYVDGLRHGTLTSFRGATPDPDQSALAGLADAPSLWWEWLTPVSARATFTASSPDGALRVLVGEQAPLATFVPLADSGADWLGEVEISLQVNAGALYRIGVFATPGTEPTCTVSWETDVLRIVSPRANSTVAVPATVRLFAQSGGGFTGGQRLEYRVNGVLVGTVTEAPYAVSWPVTEPGVYRVEATAVSADNTVQTSLPVAFLAFAGHDLPQPRIFAGTAADASYVVNSLGEVRLSGMNSGQFGLGPADGLTALHVASWPEGVHEWKMIAAGNADYYWSDLVDRFAARDDVAFASWALTGDGRLFRNGVEEVPFPDTVSAWETLVSGLGDVWLLSTDGRLFYNVTNEMTFPAGPIPWVDFGVGGRLDARFIATLAQDGRVFLHQSAPEDRWNSAELPHPAGVERWTALEVAAFQILLLDEQGRLHQLGAFGESLPPGTGLVEIPFPPGVTRWESFSVGMLHALALGDNGQLYSWGRNWEGQLGIGQTGSDVADLSLVAPPPGVTRWSAIAAGRFHSLALGDDCALYAWGDNSLGQLGLGHGAPITVPTRVPNSGVLCGFPVVFTDGKTSRLPDGSFRLTFRSDRNRSYLIQYSDDLQGQVWRTAQPPVLGTGGLMEWIDDGPPKTETHPASVETRFYRVVFD